MALTLMPNNGFGDKTNNTHEIGFLEVLPHPAGYRKDSTHINRIVQLVSCVRIHCPFEGAQLGERYLPAPKGFLG